MSHIPRVPSRHAERFFGLFLGNSPGLRAAPAASYCLSRAGELPKNNPNNIFAWRDRTRGVKASLIKHTVCTPSESPRTANYTLVTLGLHIFRKLLNALSLLHSLNCFVWKLRLRTSIYDNFQFHLNKKERGPLLPTQNRWAGADVIMFMGRAAYRDQRVLFCRGFRQAVSRSRHISRLTLW